MTVKYSYPIFTVFGTTVNIDISWLFAFILISFSLAEGFFPSLYPNLPAFQYWLVATVSAVFLFLSVLLHELSHSLVAIKHGIPVKDIYLFIFGGVALIEQEPKHPSVEFKVAIAGPIMSFFLAGMFFSFAYIYPKDNLLNGFINYLFLANLSLAVFNLIPAFPLDGGRILRSILWSKKDLLEATYIASKFGRYFGFFLIFLGGVSFLFGYFINGLWLIFLGVFIWKASKQAYLSTKISSILSRYRADNFLTTMSPLFYDEPVDNYLKMYFPFYRTYIYPVITSEGDIKFLLYEDLKKLPSYELEGRNAGDFARKYNYVLDPSEDLVRAYKLMLRKKLKEIPAVYNNTFVGILKRDVIEDLIKNYLRDEDADSTGRG
ncbi:MAG: site-2 protease family protein [Hydrogenothermaceae bacterium]|nr:site-2 protease family protein [Hydrogenothermaceae bacterium]